MKSFAICLVGLTVVLSTVGCTSIRVVHNGGYDPYGMTVSDCGSCGCEVAPPMACDSGCGPGLLHRVGDRLRSVNCNSGCGEVYWGEQINEPRVCDPCCFNGDYVGGGDCGRCPGGLARLRELWGFRYFPSDCSSCAATAAGPCESCATSDVTYEHSVAPVRQSPAPSAKPQPTPAAPPAETGSGEEIRSVVEPMPGSSAKMRSSGVSTRMVSQPRSTPRQGTPRLATR